MNPSSLKVTGAWFQVESYSAIGTTRGFIGES